MTAILPPVSDKVKSIRALISAGYVLIPLRGKIPTVKAWGDIPPGAYTEKELADCNYGVALKAGDLVVDVDPRNFEKGDDPFPRLKTLIGVQYFITFTVKTGGGGYHAYLRKSPDVPIRNDIKDFPGIEFKSLGRQVVGPGSIHPDTGMEYTIVEGSPAKVLTAAPALVDLIRRTEVPWVEIDKGLKEYVNDAGTQGRFIQYLQDIAEPSVEGKAGDHNAFKVACIGHDLGLPPATTHELMCEVWNIRCLPPWDAEELKAKVINAYKYAVGNVGGNNPAADFSPVAPESNDKKEEKIRWIQTPQGKMVKCFHNLINFLRFPDAGLNVFAYNDFTGRVEFAAPAPWHRGRLPKYPGVGDDDLKLLKGYLATRFNFEQSVMHIEEAVTNVAYHNRFHPVRSYLKSLKWGGEKRLDFWLHHSCGVEDTEYTRAVARKTLCAAVMRVMNPGIKFDHVLVLEGHQDIGKSTVVEILGGDWSADAPVDPHSRDTIQLLQGRWFVEMAEMEVLRRTDEDALKAFITRRHDMARLAYGRTIGEFPRQSIFIATKNPRADGTYLKDDTGGRRWWPVRCDPNHGVCGGQVDFKRLRAERDQLFAEAYKVALDGEKLYMETSILKTVAKEVVAQRHADPEWTECIAAWIDMLDAKPETRREFLTARGIFIDALNGTDRALDRKSVVAISNAMRILGWVPVKKEIVAGGRKISGFERVAKDPLAEL